MRGNILKYLLHHGPTAVTILAQTYSHDAFDEIVTQMITENLVVNKNSILHIE